MFLIKIAHLLFLFFLITFPYSNIYAKDNAITLAFPIDIRKKENLKNALIAATNQNWKDFTVHKNALKDTDLENYLLWKEYLEYNASIEFARLPQFLTYYHRWPHYKALRMRAEESLSPSLAAADIISFFKETPPYSFVGKHLLAEALLQTSKKNHASFVTLIRKAWCENNFSKKEEKIFYDLYKKHLRPQDHYARIDRLLYEEQFALIDRFLPYLDKAHQSLVNARQALLENKKNAETALKKVPNFLLKDVGLRYALIKWNQKNNRMEEAFPLIAALPTHLPYPEKWWPLLNRQARYAMDQHDYKKAYEIASHHRQKEGITFFESEWLAGWLCLEFLQDAHKAYHHFTTLSQHVKRPISLARASYWLGRAAKKAGDIQAAKVCFAEAMLYPTTFYGQMAFYEKNPSSLFTLPLEIIPSAAHKKKLQKNPWIRIAVYLLALKEYDEAKIFLHHAIDQAASAEEKIYISDIAHHYGTEFFSVSTAKHAIQNHALAFEAGYPLLPKTPPSDMNLAMMHAIIRQETVFNPSAISRSGALGLMQLMPKTAEETAKLMNIPYREARLLSEPYYNMSIGSYYFASLMQKYDNVPIMAIAAYNAGPTNLERWVSLHGDPRKMEDMHAVINWIEEVGFEETRNYIMRVWESYQVYRALLARNAPSSAESLVKQLILLEN